MIEESGVVAATEGDSAWVETSRRSSCGSCSANKGCGTGTLSRYFAGRAHRVQVRNPVGAKAGDEVVVGIPESGLVRGSLAVYMVPLLGMIAGAMLGQGAASLLGMTADGAAVLGGVAGIGLAFFWLRLFSRRAASDHRYQAVILRRSEPAFAVNTIKLYPKGNQ